MVFKWWFQNQMVISYSLTLRKYHQVINWNHHLRKRYHQVRYHHLRSPSSPLPSGRVSRTGSECHSWVWVDELLWKSTEEVVIINKDVGIIRLSIKLRASSRLEVKLEPQPTTKRQPQTVGHSTWKIFLPAYGNPTEWILGNSQGICTEI